MISSEYNLYFKNTHSSCYEYLALIYTFYGVIKIFKEELCKVENP